MLPTTKLKVNLKLVSGTDLCLRRVNRMSQFSLKSQDFLFSGVDKKCIITPGFSHWRFDRSRFSNFKVSVLSGAQINEIVISILST